MSNTINFSFLNKILSVFLAISLVFFTADFAWATVSAGVADNKTAEEGLDESADDENESGDLTATEIGEEDAIENEDEDEDGISDDVDDVNDSDADSDENADVDPINDSEESEAVDGEDEAIEDETELGDGKTENSDENAEDIDAESDVVLNEEDKELTNNDSENKARGIVVAASEVDNKSQDKEKIEAASVLIDDKKAVVVDSNVTLTMSNGKITITKKDGENSESITVDSKILSEITFEGTDGDNTITIDNMTLNAINIKNNATLVLNGNNKIGKITSNADLTIMAGSGTARLDITDSSLSVGESGKLIVESGCVSANIKSDGSNLDAVMALAGAEITDPSKWCKLVFCQPYGAIVKVQIMKVGDTIMQADRGNLGLANGAAYGSTAKGFYDYSSWNEIDEQGNLIKYSNQAAWDNFNWDSAGTRVFYANYNLPSSMSKLKLMVNGEEVGSIAINPSFGKLMLDVIYANGENPTVYDKSLFEAMQGFNFKTGEIFSFDTLFTGDSLLFDPFIVADSTNPTITDVEALNAIIERMGYDRYEIGKKSNKEKMRLIDWEQFVFSVSGGNACLNFYTISFDSDGGTTFNDRVMSAGAAIDEVPTKDGCTFLGWYLDGERVDNLSELVKRRIFNATLSAKWDKVVKLDPEVLDVSDGNIVISKNEDGKTYTLAHNGDEKILQGGDLHKLVFTDSDMTGKTVTLKDVSADMLQFQGNLNIVLDGKSTIKEIKAISANLLSADSNDSCSPFMSTLTITSKGDSANNTLVIDGDIADNVRLCIKSGKVCNTVSPVPNTSVIKALANAEIANPNKWCKFVFCQPDGSIIKVQIVEVGTTIHRSDRVLLEETNSNAYLEGGYYSWGNWTEIVNGEAKERPLSGELWYEKDWTDYKNNGMSGERVFFIEYKYPEPAHTIELVVNDVTIGTVTVNHSFQKRVEDAIYRGDKKSFTYTGNEFDQEEVGYAPNGESEVFNVGNYYSLDTLISDNYRIGIANNDAVIEDEGVLDEFMKMLGYDEAEIAALETNEKINLIPWESILCVKKADSKTGKDYVASATIDPEPATPADPEPEPVVPANPTEPEAETAVPPADETTAPDNSSTIEPEQSTAPTRPVVEDDAAYGLQESNDILGPSPIEPLVASDNAIDEGETAVVSGGSSVVRSVRSLSDLDVSSGSASSEEVVIEDNENPLGVAEENSGAMPLSAAVGGSVVATAGGALLLFGIARRKSESEEEAIAIDILS